MCVVSRRRLSAVSAAAAAAPRPCSRLLPPPRRRRYGRLTIHAGLAGYAATPRRAASQPACQEAGCRAAPAQSKHLNC
jgi:hypothetical protein